MNTSAQGLLLLAHGSRDPLWRQPFESMAQTIASRHTGPVVLAFLEFMQPTLNEGLHLLTQQGASQLSVCPLFLAAGHHLRHDVPALVQQWQTTHPQMSVTLREPLGCDATMQAAIADWALRSTV